MIPQLDKTRELATMAPISPVSRKRSTPSHSDDDLTEMPSSKRRCIKPALPHTPPPEDAFVISTERVPLFDDDPKMLLQRSIAIVLNKVGFDSGTPEAMQAFGEEVESYAARFLSMITKHMLNARRSMPTPLDYEYALARFDLPTSSLEPHIKPPVPVSQVLIQLEAEPQEKRSSHSTIALLGEELSGESDRQVKLFIPKKFPAFPSKHTYKWTEKESSRETDPRKIREEAGKAARQGEEALRRLVNVSKIAKEKNAKKTASKDPLSKERHELWESTMRDLLAGKQQLISDVKEDHSMIVNSEKRYHRKRASAEKKQVTEPAK